MTINFWPHNIKINWRLILCWETGSIYLMAELYVSSCHCCIQATKFSVGFVKLQKHDRSLFFLANKYFELHLKLLQFCLFDSAKRLNLSKLSEKIQNFMLLLDALYETS